MILHWEQLGLHFGTALNIFAPRFETAGRATFGLLCCRFTPSDDRIEQSDGDHAEARLLQSPTWTTEIPQALADWTPHSSPILVVMVINRSPCQPCSNLLIGALEDLSRQSPVAVEANRFILAARGAYEDRAMEVPTLQRDLVRLRDVGWELCVLQTGNALSQRGAILLEGIQRVAGRGYVRLG
jgi:hypothetical protein